MQLYGYKTKLYSFLKNLAAEEKFILVQDSNLGLMPIYGSRATNWANQEAGCL